MTWDGVALTASIMIRYNIDIAAIILHERDFGETMTFPLTCLMQRLFNETSVLEVPGVDEREESKAVGQSKMMKDPA